MPSENCNLEPVLFLLEMSTAWRRTLHEKQHDFSSDVWSETKISDGEPSPKWRLKFKESTKNRNC